ncbi:MAG: anthranilate phosphoribosyltransferase [Myxococcales bacterium]|nr:anthranilate phosphoribosyltransferase [Myxococcales bacterium]
MRDAIARVARGEALDGPAMQAAMREILAGEATPAQIAGLAIGLRVRGETTTEIAAAARALREAATPLPRTTPGPLLDTCGTGGDGLSTFNVSTVSAIVVAACGVRVAKHGNRAVSSRAGSADVLEALGLRIDLSPERAAEVLDAVGITFLFAPAHHGALRHAAPVRRDLGVRTFFNLLGPLANPAGATHQLVGLYDPSRLRDVAEVLGALGVERAWVVHGEGGLDEITTRGSTQVARLEAGSVQEGALSPQDFGLDEAPLEACAGGDALENAAITRAILQGEPGPRRTMVLLNAGAALCVAGAAERPREGAAMAAAAIDRGAALATLDAWVEATHAHAEARA